MFYNFFVKACSIHYNFDHNCIIEYSSFYISSRTLTGRQLKNGKKKNKKRAWQKRRERKSDEKKKKKLNEKMK